MDGADDDRPFRVEDAHFAQTQPGQRPVEDAGVAVGEDDAPGVGAHDDIHQHRRDDHNGEDAADERRTARHQERHGKAKQHGDQRGQEADPQRCQHGLAVKVDGEEPDVVGYREVRADLAGPGLLVEAVADHQSDRDEEDDEKKDDDRPDEQQRRDMALARPPGREPTCRARTQRCCRHAYFARSLWLHRSKICAC